MVTGRALSAMLDRDIETAAKRAGYLRLPPLSLMFAHRSKRLPVPVVTAEPLAKKLRRPEPGGRARYRASGKPVQRANASAGHRDTRKGRKSSAVKP
jgi:hypothetical protein